MTNMKVVQPQMQARKPAQSISHGLSSKAKVRHDLSVGSDEFGTILYGDNPSRTYKVGDKLEVIVSHCDPVVNLYDQMYAIRGDKVGGLANFSTWNVCLSGADLGIKQGAHEDSTSFRAGLILS